MIKGKYGYYPCNYEMYKKLKRLNLLYFDAMKSKNKWERWYKKDPHNRVTRQKLRDSSGRVVGYEAPLPVAEPEVCPIFCKKITYSSFRDKKGNYHKDGVDLVKIEMQPDVFNWYCRARYPAVTESKPFDKSEIRCIEEYWAAFVKQ
jgi:hypothetical protein